MAKALVTVPRTARRGEIVEIRTLIAHPMETGYRVGADGKLMRRDILTRFVCRYNGTQVFAAELHRAIAANPLISFFIVATDSGRLDFEWEGDHGFSHREAVAIEVA